MENQEMKQPQIQPIFATPVMFDKLDLDNEKIVEYIHSKKDEHEVSIYFKDEDYNESPAMQQLFFEIMSRVEYLHDSLNLDKDYYHRMYLSWATLGMNQYISDCHNHNDHPMGMFSGVYYPQVNEDSHPLLLKNPNAMNSFTFRDKMKNGGASGSNTFTAHSWTIKPETGMLIIFPSYLEHQVLDRHTQGTTAENRVSLAFNTLVQLKPNVQQNVW